VKSHYLLWSFAAITISFGAACGGGGGGGGNGLFGVINTASFEIPAGETRTVTGDLTVNSTGPITINGTLLIPDNANVALLAGGEVVVGGEIKPSGTKAPANGKTTDGEKLLLIGGDNVTVNGPITSPIRIMMFVNDETDSRQQTGTIALSEPVRTEDGRDSTHYATDGGDAAGIDIGTFEAVLAAQAKGVKGMAPLDIEEVLTQGSTGLIIRAGRGGHGVDDPNGTPQGKNRIYRASSGGKGGSVKLVANNIKLLSGVRAGHGGRGGSCGADGARAGDGTAEGEKGGNVEMKLGSGGRGGDLALTGTLVMGSGGLTVAAGNGGNAGEALGGGPGNGGPAGAGGDMSIEVGTPGAGGDGPAGWIDGDPGKKASITIKRAGNGGYSWNPNLAGGNGGNLTLTAKQGQPDYEKLVLDNSFAGALGFDGCKVLPHTSGSNGGKGGVVSHLAQLLNSSANGGRGGDGVQAGVGGEAGVVPGASPTPGAAGGGCHFDTTHIQGFGFLAVKLEFPTGPFAKGDIIPLIRLFGGGVSGPEQNWNHHHLHGIIAVVARLQGQRTELGPYPDPAPEASGHGSIITVPSPEIQTQSQYK
jgi:hypothetical protein